MKARLSKIHFPTALGLLILLVALGIGIVLVRNKTSLIPQASESAEPKQVYIANVTDTSFSVSWLTDQRVGGSIKSGTETGSLKQTALDDRDQLSGETGNYEVHHVTVKNLTPSTEYFFEIVSGRDKYDNNGKSFEVTSGSTLGTPPAADTAYGTVLMPSGTPAEGVVVYVTVSGAAPLSALTKANGSWALSLSTARTTDLAAYLTYDTQATVVNLMVQGGSLGTATAVTNTINDSPVPDISLGQTYDFSKDSGDSQSRLLDSGDQVNELDGDDEGDGFDFDLLSNATDSGEVSLENPGFEGEVINATQPAFIGTGPPGTVLSVEINSEDVYTGSTTIDEDGEWEFVPPQGLDVGEHTITIHYIDTEGIEQTLNRGFVIAAEGDSEDPAIIATPSATATPSAQPRTSLPSTDSGVPEPGVFTPTIMMFIMGLGLLLAGVVLKVRI